MAAVAPGLAPHALPLTTAPVRRPDQRSWWPDLIGSTAAASIIIVVALWLRGGNLQSLSGNGALTSLGRLTGLIAADLLLIQVLLMARVPWIERAYGQDRLARWHRSSASARST